MSGVAREVTSLPDVAFNRNQIQKGSKSFSFASFFFSSLERQGAWALYAWCRYCDDQIDQADNAQAALQALEDLERETRACYQPGFTSNNPVFQSMTWVVRAFQIPQKYPLDLLRGMRLDVEDRGFETLSELEDYCYCVAGVVGLMMCHVMGVNRTEALSNAVAMGQAMQLTNICRDVDQDLKINRIYFPREWLRELGFETANPATLRTQFAADRGRKNWQVLSERALVRADELYAEGLVGLNALSFRAALAVAIAARVYRKIGTKVRRQGVRAWDSRAYTTLPEKLWTATCASVAVAGRLLSRIWRPWSPRTIDVIWGKS